MVEPALRADATTSSMTDAPAVVRKERMISLMR